MICQMRHDQAGIIRSFIMYTSNIVSTLAVALSRVSIFVHEIFRINARQISEFGRQIFLKA